MAWLRSCFQLHLSRIHDCHEWSTMARNDQLRKVSDFLNRDHWGLTQFRIAVSDQNKEEWPTRVEMILAKKNNEKIMNRDRDWLGRDWLFTLLGEWMQWENEVIFELGRKRMTYWKRNLKYTSVSGYVVFAFTLVFRACSVFRVFFDVTEGKFQIASTSKAGFQSFEKQYCRFYSSLNGRHDRALRNTRCAVRTKDYLQFHCLIRIIKALYRLTKNRTILLFEHSG